MRGRERERDIEKKGTSEIPQTNLCCVFLLCFMLLSLSVPLFFVLSMSLLCVYLLSFSISASLFFFLFLHPFFFWIMAAQLSFGSLFFSFQSFLIGNGRLGGFLASRGLPLYIYILNIFWSHPIIQSTTVSLLFVLSCRCMYL